MRYFTANTPLKNGAKLGIITEKGGLTTNYTV